MIAEGVSPFKPNTTKKTHSSIFTPNIFVEHDKSPIPYDTEWSYTKLIALMHPILHPTHISYPTHTPSLPLPSPHTPPSTIVNPFQNLLFFPFQGQLYSSALLHTMSSEVPVWSREEEKAFENAIAMHWTEDCKEVWDKIASMVPGKSVDELKQHYQFLVEDVNAIEAGHIPLPNYAADEASSSSVKDHHALPSATSDKRSNCGFGGGFSGLGHDSAVQGGKGGSRSEQERRKGIPWTEEEHRYI